MNEKMKENLMQFILKKVKESTSKEKPYFYVRWSGLAELCRMYGYNVVELIDEMVSLGMLKKGLIKGKLVIYLPDMCTSKKLKQINSEFEEFIKKLK